MDKVESISNVGTQSALDFYTTYDAAVRFAEYLVQLASRVSGTSEIARAALYEAARNEDERERFAPSGEYLEPIVELAAHRQFMIEALVARHIDNYLNYLSSLLFEIFVKRPESMKSREKVEMGFVLEHASMESLARGLAQRKVDSLSYSSFRQLIDYFDDRFSLEVCTAKDFEDINEAVEIRNVIVHNRARVNDRFVQKTGRRSESIGEQISLGNDTLDEIRGRLLSSVSALDSQARRRLGLEICEFDVGLGFDQALEEARTRVERIADGGST